MKTRVGLSLAAALTAAGMMVSTFQPAHADISWSDDFYANVVPNMNELPQGGGKGEYASYMAGVIGPQRNVSSSTRTFALAPVDVAPEFFGSGAHVADCKARFRSYNQATNSYIGFDGRLHRCVTP